MPIITIHDAKTNLSRLIKRAAPGEEIIIARGDKPVARLVALGEVKGKRQLRSLRRKSRRGNSGPCELFSTLTPCCVGFQMTRR